MDGDSRLGATHEALRLGREKKIAPLEVLKRVVEGQLTVPLRAPPEVVGGRIAAWDPALLSKPDGSAWLVAFTSLEGLEGFCEANPEYETYARVDTRWVVDHLADNLGIVFNPQSGDMLQWSAEGRARFRQDFPPG
jgi:hypothetical protein